MQVAIWFFSCSAGVFAVNFSCHGYTLAVIMEPIIGGSAMIRFTYMSFFGKIFHTSFAIARLNIIAYATIFGSCILE
jgi:hypothetical protein